MKQTSLFLLAGLFLTSGAFAAGPGVLTVQGTISRPGSPDGQCGASTHGFIIDASYKDTAGKDLNFSGCLESMSVPLSSSIKVHSTKNLLNDSINVLKKVESQDVTMIFAFTNIDDAGYSGPSSGTLISIELQKAAAQ